MKYAADFRQIARNALHGNWGNAVLTGFIASLIGANITSGSGVSYSNNSSVSDGTSNSQITELIEQFLPIILIIFAILTIWSIAVTIISGPGKLGYAKFNLNLIDQKPASLSDLFSQFNRLGAGFCMNLLVGIYTILWTLLFIVPGIIKSYSYAMTPYILYEHPEMSANQAITESRRIMKGYKGRLFCLNLSFIGWELLYLLPVLVLIPLIFIGVVGVVLWAILSIGLIFVGHLFLIPYREAAQAAFYREITAAYTQVITPTEPQDIQN